MKELLIIKFSLYEWILENVINGCLEKFKNDYCKKKRVEEYFNTHVLIVCAWHAFFARFAKITCMETDARIMRHVLTPHICINVCTVRLGYYIQSFGLKNHPKSGMTLHPGNNLDRVVDLASEKTLNPWTVRDRMHSLCLNM